MDNLIKPPRPNFKTEQPPSSQEVPTRIDQAELENNRSEGRAPEGLSPTDKLEEADNTAGAPSNPQLEPSSLGVTGEKISSEEPPRITGVKDQSPPSDLEEKIIGIISANNND